MRIRALDLAAPAELDWVAQGMRATLIEVEGEVVGTSLYSLDWLRERARWHAEQLELPAAVLLIVDAQNAILGHIIVREDPAGEGLISTSYVLPAARRQGLGQALLAAGEDWMLARGLHQACTWTSASNQPLIALYERSGYRRAEQHRHEQTGTWMLALRRSLLP
jgi:ribosomal protein S18 acetylase RimI-like enzyme